MFEPTNVTSFVEVSPEENTYIDYENQPRVLHPYLNAFARNNVDLLDHTRSIETCTDVGVCVGPGNNRHFFMLKEGSNVCDNCSKLICPTCTFEQEVQTYCVHCFAGEHLVSIEDVDADKSTDVMVDELTNRGYSITNSDSVDEIMDLYDVVITKNNGIFNESIVTTVTMPKHNTNFLKTLVPLTTLFLSNGGTFIHDPKLHLNSVVEVLEILVELVNIKKIEEGVTKTDIIRTYSVVPTLIIELAQNSRVDKGGYRLLKRCVRHALDSAAIDVRHAVIDVCGVTALAITHRVKASMKNDTYNVRVCFNTKEIIACQCDCKCGSNDDERVVCVHILPCIYQVSLLIFEGLGEHLLIELAAYVGRLNESDVTADTNLALQRIVTSLLFAVTRSIPVVTTEETGFVPLKIMLNNFSVGTDKRKTMPAPPTDRKMLQPLRLLDRRSAIAKAAVIVNAKKNNDVVVDVVVGDQAIDDGTVVGDDEVVNVPLDTEEDANSLTKEVYSTIVNSCWDFCRLYKQKSSDTFLTDVVGYRVLAKRSTSGKSFADITRNDIPTMTTRKLLDLINHANGNVNAKKRAPQSSRESYSDESILQDLINHANASIGSDKENYSDSSTVIVNWSDKDSEASEDVLMEDIGGAFNDLAEDIVCLPTLNKRMTCCA
jgi:hypothetical protein